jgi:hypothetical protein
VATPAASVTALVTPKSQTPAASTPVKAPRQAVDIAHSTLRSRANVASPPAGITAPPAPSAAAAAAKSASCAASGMPGHTWRTAASPAATASAPPR